TVTGWRCAGWSNAWGPMPRTAKRKKRDKSARPEAPSGSLRPKSNAAKPAPPNIAVAGFQLHELKRLIHLVQKTGIGELELNAGGRSVRISATAPSGGPGVAAAPAAGPGAAPAAPAPVAA